LYRVTYTIGVTDPLERAFCIGKVLKAICHIDADYLRAHPEVQGPVQTRGIKIVPEPRDVDEWHDIPTMIREGRATLPEIRCWQAAYDHVRLRRPLQVPVLETIDPEQGRYILAVDLFDGDEERQLSHRALCFMLVGLTELAAFQLKCHPEWPDLYDSGVRYEEEPPGQEDWQDPKTCLDLGTFDCEDGACWRAAELNVRYHIKAYPTFLWRKRPNGSYLYHIQTKYPDGRIEDPSRRLGMR
jgi:hypothetical protein